MLVTHEADIAMHAHRVIHIRDGKVDRDERVKLHQNFDGANPPQQTTN